MSDDVPNALFCSFSIPEIYPFYAPIAVQDTYATRRCREEPQIDWVSAGFTTGLSTEIVDNFYPYSANIVMLRPTT